MSNFYEELEAYEDQTDPIARLKKEIPLELFYELDVPLYAVPKIHRRAPFEDLPSLKRHYIDRAILSLYRGVDIPLDKITLFTWVIADGVGDWSLEERFAQQINKFFPSTEIYLISLLHEKRRPPSFRALAHEVFTYYEETDECIQKMSSSDLIIQAPTFYPKWDELEKKCPRSQVEHIGEYGFIDSPSFNPLTKARSMGLHFLEKGVLIPEDFDPTPRTTVKGRYLSYITTERGFVVFLAAVSALKGTDVVEIFVPKFEHLFTHLEAIKSFGKTHGVKVIEFYADGTVCPIPIQNEGKTIKIFYKSDMPREEFLDLMKTSEIVGCRGNQSLMEAISCGKPFFYDPAKHNLPFLYDLVALARDRAPRLHHLFSLLTDAMDADVEGWLALGVELSQAYNDPSLPQEIQSLYELLNREYCFNPILEGLVKRAAYIKKHPGHLLFEQDLIRQTIEGSLPFTTLYTTLKDKIDGSAHRHR